MSLVTQVNSRPTISFYNLVFLLFIGSSLWVFYNLKYHFLFIDWLSIEKEPPMPPRYLTNIINIKEKIPVRINSTIKVNTPHLTNSPHQSLSFLVSLNWAHIGKMVLFLTKRGTKSHQNTSPNIMIKISVFVRPLIISINYAMGGKNNNRGNKGRHP